MSYTAVKLDRKYSDSTLPTDRSKSIRFNDEVEMIEVERFSHQIVSGNLWYSEAEYFAIERENLKISWQRMNNKELKDDEKQSIRGLEHQVNPSDACRRRQTEDRAFEAVMAEQDDQDRRCVCDPYAVAEAYQKNGARQSQLEAYAIGLEDFENVAKDSGNSLQQIDKFLSLSQSSCLYETPHGFNSNEKRHIPQ